MRISVIDIGTNTVLLLIADVDQAGEVTPVHHGHAIARLGKSVDESRTISSDSLERVTGILAEFVSLSQRHQADLMVACGTSALRDASNRLEVVEHIRSNLKIDVRILSGEEEAELTYRGAIGEFQRSGVARDFAVLDIGGGSTEIIVGEESRIRSKRSIDVGCVRLTERFLKASPPTSLNISQALRSIREEIAPFAPLESTARLIGVAGTLTTLAAIDLNLPAYDPSKVSGHVLKKESIQTIFNQLRIKTLEELKAIPQILEGRADILLAGILILLEVMNQLEATEISVSDRGLRYGIAMEVGRGH